MPDNIRNSYDKVAKEKSNVKIKIYTYIKHCVAQLTSKNVNFIITWLSRRKATENKNERKIQYEN